MNTASNIEEQIAALSPAKKALFEQLRQQRDAVASGRIPQRTNRDFAPLSFAQQRLFFLDQLEPGKAIYNVPVAKRISGPLDVESLQQAINEIVRRHEALRSSFSMNGSGVVQHVSESTQIPLRLIDISHLPEAERETEGKRLAFNEQVQSFDLTQPPLIRAALVKLSDDDHLLLITLHHIACDGWSLGILTDELTTLYADFSAGKQSTLPELPIQYADYAVWQRERLQGEELTRQVSYWKSQLSDISGALDLPTDQPRPQSLSYRGSSQVVTLSKDLIEQLTKLGQQEGATLFMTLFAAFQTLLYRYTNQTDIVVGTPIANRRRVETEKLIGFFVNTLALRTDFGGDPTFQQLLRRVKETALAAYAHQDLPFEKLVEELQPERTLNRNPLFDVLLAFQNAPPSTATQLNIRPWVVENEFTRFDLEVYLTETTDGVRCKFVYSTDLFAPETVKRMMGHFQLLLQSIASNHGERVSQLRILPEQERRQLLFDWNNTQTSYPQTSLARLFEEQVERSPEAVALVFGTETVTYAELNTRANQLAHYLKRLGAGPEALVGICVERSIAMVVGILGILKAGGAYLPLDKSYPAKRIAFMLQDARPALLLTQTELLSQLPTGDVRTVCIDGDRELIAREDAGNPRSETAPDNLAYVMYTSGSTGEPKGVSVTQRNVVRLVKETNFATLNANEVFLQFAPITFDASTLELWGPLLNGARLVVFPPYTPTLDELGQTIEQNQITTLWLTSGLFHQLVDERPQSFRNVRQLLAGGDVLSVPHVEKALQFINGNHLINGYGPTENTTFTCFHLIKSSSARSIPIGRPLANTQVFVLDEKLEPVPVNVIGELYVAGDGLARGYLNSPEQTAQRFIPHPFSSEPGARLYRTGDFVRHLSNGELEFIGRRDEQLKVRGFRIEPAEIETVLMNHPAVRNAVVVAQKGVVGGKRLIAYLTNRNGETCSSAELRNYLKERLPDYMVPSNFVTLKALPLTANGKVNRQALPKPDASNQELDHQFVAPRNAEEEGIARIWQKVLHVERVSIRDNFFELGGHSMSAMQLMSQIEKSYGKKIPLSVLFREATVECLARFITSDEPYAQLTRLEIKPGTSYPPFFCVSAPNVNALGYVRLAQHLDEDQPVYALQSAFRKRSEGEYSPDEVEALATEYIRSMRQFQPEGPYMFGGMCAGGLIAFEMARQLEEAGQQSALVGIFDTWNIHTYTWLWVLDYYSRRFKGLWKQARHGELSLAIRAAGRSVKNLGARFLPKAVRHESPAADDPWRTGYEPPPDFVPKVYSGRVTVFRIPRGPYYRIKDEALGWRNRALGGVDVEVVPGTHETIFREPNVRVLAEKLTQRIRAAHRS